MTSKAIHVDIAKIASKVLLLPTVIWPKQPSQRLLQEIKGSFTDFAKIKERANRIMELGRNEGFLDPEISKWVR